MIRKTTKNAQDIYELFYKNAHIQGRYTAFIRGKRSTTLKGFLREYSAAFQFPSYFGENWAAWDECATDLKWLSFDSIAVIIDNYDCLFVDEPDTDSLLADFEAEIRYIEDYWQNCMSIQFLVFACLGCEEK